MFTGRHPFSEFPALVAISKIMSGERPDRPQESSLIDSVWDTTLRCWDEDPVQRPTMTRVVGTLREWPVFFFSSRNQHHNVFPILCSSRPCDADLGPSTLAPLPQEILALLPESEGAESTRGLNHGVKCNSCSRVRLPPSVRFAGIRKEAYFHCTQGDYRYSVSMWELSYHSVPLQSGL